MKRGKVWTEEVKNKKLCNSTAAARSCNIKNRWKEIISYYERSCAWKQKCHLRIELYRQAKKEWKKGTNWKLSQNLVHVEGKGGLAVKYYLQCHLFHLKFHDIKATETTVKVEK